MACHILHLLLLLTVGIVGIANVKANAAVSPQLYWKSALPKTTMPKSIRDALESKNTKWTVSKQELKPSSLLDIEQLQMRVANPHNPNLFFLEQDIVNNNGKDMTLDLSAPPSARSAKFLPRHEAEKIPFSSKKLPEILNHLSVKPGSVEARTIETTLKRLEQRPATRGQHNFVATSLESMVDFVQSKIEIEVKDGVEVEVKKGGDIEVEIEKGKVEIEIEVESTEIEIEIEVDGKEVLEIELPIGKFGKKGTCKKILSRKAKAWICHRLKYPYAVHACHKIHKKRAYKVPLEGPNGLKVNALALCHVDTSGWNPNHSAFKTLNIERGTVPVCHFLPQDHILWYNKN